MNPFSPFPERVKVGQHFYSSTTPHYLPFTSLGYLFCPFTSLYLSIPKRYLYLSGQISLLGWVYPDKRSLPAPDPHGDALWAGPTLPTSIICFDVRMKRGRRRRRN